MPIGTGKVGLFGGGFSVEAGCQTFNSPGSFIVPDGLSIVSLSGNGSTGNPGNAGNSGGDGPGGTGGSGGPVTDPGGTNWASNVYNITKGCGGIGAVGNPPGGSGNPGNPGGPTSALGYNWTCGAVGNGGAGGVNGVVGNPGTTGNRVNGNVLCACFAPEPSFAKSNPSPGGTGASNISVSPPNQKGGTAAYGIAGTTQCQNPSGKYFLKFIQNNAYGGGGGGGQCRQGVSFPGTLCGGCPSFGPPWNFNGVPPAGIPAFSPQGGSGRGGIGKKSVNQNSNLASNPCGTSANAFNTPIDYGQGGGGGGGGGATSVLPNQFCGSPPGLGAQASSGGGGGGMGSSGNPGGGAGNPGSAGTPATYNGAPVTAGTYPVSVGTGGQITISWNAQ